MIRFERDKATRKWNLILGKNAFIHTINDWEQLYNLLTGKSKYNWYSFHLIYFYFENDIICPGFEVEMALLGFGLRFRHNRSWEGTEIQKSIDEVDEWLEEKETTQGQENKHDQI